MSSSDRLPDEVVDYILIDEFKCLPSELDKEDNDRLMEYLEIKSFIQKEQARHSKQKNKHKRHGR